MTTQSQAAQRVAAIKTCLLDWHFANNPQNVGELERLASKMQLAMSEFGGEFLRGDASDLKKQYAPDVLCHLTGFLAAAADAQELQAANSSLQCMQRKRKAPVARIDQCGRPRATL